MQHHSFGNHHGDVMSTLNEERNAFALSGWLALLLWLAGAALTGGPLVQAIVHGQPLPIDTRLIGIPLLFLLAKGFLVQPPNIAAVFTFFGRYAGTLRASGFYWVNPFFQRERISLRVHNLTTPTLKVNDRAGNPVEVAAVVVWRVADTARALFDVEDYGTYGLNSLRGDMDAVARLLAETIQDHVLLAGIEIVEARIAHLAYAPEIASAMLRRQQAEAVVAARSHIVEGAVSMVRLAIDQLEREGVVKLAEADRVHLVGNLLTVLVSDNETHPVISVDKGG